MPTDHPDVTIPDSLKATPEPVDPVEAAVAAVKIDTTPYVMELAQAAQAYYHPEAQNADAMPYKESAERFFVFAQAGGPVYEKYQHDLGVAKDKARQEAQEKLKADEAAKAQADQERAAAVSKAQAAHEETPATAPPDAPSSISSEPLSPPRADTAPPPSFTTMSPSPALATPI